MGNDYFTGGNAKSKAVPQAERDRILGASAPVSKARVKSGNALSWAVKHHAELLSGILIAFAIVVVFTAEFDFEGTFWASVVDVETLILATCTYIVYLNAYVIGTNTATASDFTITVHDAYKGEIKKIRDQRIEWMLELFCNDYRAGELKNAKTEILLCAGFTEKQIALVLDGKPINEDRLLEDQKKALQKARDLKPIKLNKAMLVNPYNGHRDRSPIRSATAIQIQKYSSFFTKLVFVIVSFTVVVSLTIKLTSDFSLGAIIYALLQIVLLFVSLFGGMSLGYKIKTKYTERVQDIVGVLYEFWEWLDWHNRQAIAEEPSEEANAEVSDNVGAELGQEAQNSA